MARTVIADHVAEIIDQHQRQAAAADEEEGDEEGDEEGKKVNGDEGSALDVAAAEGTALDGGEYASDAGHTNHHLTTSDPEEHQSDVEDDDDGDDDDNDDDADVVAPSLDDRLQAEALAALAAVESSCLSGVDSWAEDARRRARELEHSLAVDAASHDREEQGTAGAEVETLELAFYAARKNPEDAPVVGSRVFLLPSPGGGDDDDSDAVAGAAVVGRTTSTLAGSTSPAAPEGGVESSATSRNEAEESVPDFVVEEQEESRFFWSSFEPPLASLRLRLGAASEQPTGTTSGLLPDQREGRGHDPEDAKDGGDEEEETDGEGEAARRESAVRVIARLETGLRDELAETFSATGRGEEVRAMVREGNEELRLAVVVIAERRRAKRREEKRKRTLALLLAKEEKEERRRKGIERAEAERAKGALLLEDEERAKAMAQESLGADVLSVPAAGGGG